MICKNCGKAYSDSYQHCPYCGTIAEEPTPVPTKIRRLHCPNCGTELYEGVVYCPRCGQKGVDTTESLYCLHCNMELDDGSVYCPVCGRKGVNRFVYESYRQNCPKCGNPLNAGDTECAKCHTPIKPLISLSSVRQTSPAGKPVPGPAPNRRAVSLKNRWVALVLLILFGALGVHRFYAGRVKGGAVMLGCDLAAIIFLIVGVLQTNEAAALAWMVIALILALIAAVLLIVDFFQILIGCFKDGDGFPMV